MPNHIHFMLKQLVENGIKTFMSNIQNGFAKYLNTKYHRHGSLFCHPFQYKHIIGDELFIHVVRYIHLNPVTAYIIEIDELPYYQWTSFSTYMGNTDYSFVTKDLTQAQFISKKSHEKFVFNQSDYQRSSKKFKGLTME